MNKEKHTSKVSQEPNGILRNNSIKPLEENPKEHCPCNKQTAETDKANAPEGFEKQIEELEEDFILENSIKKAFGESSK